MLTDMVKRELEKIAAVKDTDSGNFLVNHPLIGGLLLDTGVNTLSIPAGIGINELFGFDKLDDPKLFDELKEKILKDTKIPVVESKTPGLAKYMEGYAYYDPRTKHIMVNTSKGKNPYTLAHEAGHAFNTPLKKVPEQMRHAQVRGLGKNISTLGTLTTLLFADDPETRDTALKSVAAASAVGSLPVLVEEMKASKKGLELLKSLEKRPALPGAKKPYRWLGSGYLPALATYGVTAGLQAGLPLLANALTKGVTRPSEDGVKTSILSTVKTMLGNIKTAEKSWVQESLEESPIIGASLVGYPAGVAGGLYNLGVEEYLKKFKDEDAKIYDDLKEVIKKTGLGVDKGPRRPFTEGRTFYDPMFKTIRTTDVYGKNPYILGKELGSAALDKTGYDVKKMLLKHTLMPMLPGALSTLGIASAYGLTDDADTRDKVLKTTSALSTLAALPELIEDIRASNLGVKVINKLKHPAERILAPKGFKIPGSSPWLKTLGPLLSKSLVEIGLTAGTPLLLANYFNEPESKKVKVKESMTTTVKNMLAEINKKAGLNEELARVEEENATRKNLLKDTLWYAFKGGLPAATTSVGLNIAKDIVGEL